MPSPQATVWYCKQHKDLLERWNSDNERLLSAPGYEKGIREEAAKRDLERKYHIEGLKIFKQQQHARDFNTWLKIQLGSVNFVNSSFKGAIKGKLKLYVIATTREPGNEKSYGADKEIKLEYLDPNEKLFYRRNLAKTLSEADKKDPQKKQVPSSPAIGPNDVELLEKPAASTMPATAPIFRGEHVFEDTRLLFLPWAAQDSTIHFVVEGEVSIRDGNKQCFFPCGGVSTRSFKARSTAMDIESLMNRRVSDLKEPLPREWSEEEKARRAEKVKLFIDRQDEDSKKVCKELQVSANPDAKDDPLYDIFEIQFDIVEKMEVATSETSNGLDKNKNA